MRKPVDKNLAKPGEASAIGPCNCRCSCSATSIKAEEPAPEVVRSTSMVASDVTLSQIPQGEGTPAQ